jgi:hypothetical protein
VSSPESTQGRPSPSYNHITSVNCRSASTALSITSVLVAPCDPVIGFSHIVSRLLCHSQGRHSRRRSPSLTGGRVSLCCCTLSHWLVTTTN